jgi:NAD(P)-dependent dehydrogenase (short-subunit alcohol dehydrogenase family)
MGELQGKRTLVTGAAAGIGREIAQVFTEQGAQVMLSDVAEDRLAKAAADLGSPSVRCDVSRSSDVQAAIAATVEAFGGIDVVVNNAGIETVSTLLDLTEEELDRILAVNLKGVFFGIKYGAPAIIASGGGSIVNMASVAGLGGFGLLGAYCASKHGVMGLTRVAAIELRDAGVRVNAVCPTFLETEMVARGAPIIEAALQVEFGPVIQHFQGRLGTPREAAEACAFLASERASFINGVAFAVDNALTARLL